MAKIIRLDAARRASLRETGKPGCQHKSATVYTAYRTVNCSFCGCLLDPYDVLVDMVKGYIPAGREDEEERRFTVEVVKRQDADHDEEAGTD
ncbi:MAG: hypothetical protein A2521_01060 [Deltaproteobacteria bacterium RIFOXYD12_FULL_57_12]|nr:MAG: hypothetical protein A2521_01060 [Deltaproteobacteria bacterium RIFOXYD12_FULL_57_12]